MNRTGGLGRIFGDLSTRCCPCHAYVRYTREMAEYRDKKATEEDKHVAGKQEDVASDADTSESD